MNVAVYARVSTNRQQQTQTIEHQLDRLHAYIASQPEWHLADKHTYRDEGYSGASLNRPGLDCLRDHAALAAFERVVITSPDRLARKYVHQVLLLEELAKRGCEVVFLDRPMSDNPHDQLLLHIRGAVAEYERSLIADRMRRGRQAKLRSGQLLPWTIPPYGYVLDPVHPRDPHCVHVDPSQAAVVAQIFAWYTDPQTPATLFWVAQQLTAAGIPTPRGKPRWSRSTIRAILRDSAYIGITYGGRTRTVRAHRRQSPLRPVGPGTSQQPAPPDGWIPITVPAIIGRDTFEAAQARLDQNTRWARRHNTSYAYLLRALVSCGHCELACSGRTDHHGYSYYRCRGRTDGLRAAPTARCTAPYISAPALDALVWQDLCQILADPALITHELQRAQAGEWLPQALQARRRTIHEALRQLERQQARLLEVYLAELIERQEFERKRHEIYQSRQGLSQQLRHLEAQVQHQLDLLGLSHHIVTFCQRLQPTLGRLDFTQRRQLVELLIDRVIVSESRVEIRYVIPTSPRGETVPFCHLRLDYLR